MTQPKRDSNPGSSAHEADTSPLGQRDGGLSAGTSWYCVLVNLTGDIVSGGRVYRRVSNSSTGLRREQY